MIQNFGNINININNNFNINENIGNSENKEKEIFESAFEKNNKTTSIKKDNGQLKILKINQNGNNNNNKILPTKFLSKDNIKTVNSPDTNKNNVLTPHSKKNDVKYLNTDRNDTKVVSTNKLYHTFNFKITKEITSNII